ncbi:hypothetical protein CCM_08338 [Cordyceps militaris CM01]|uniref:Uncharacterized protein n=1 Tax=Cordyceps militaris (strain CM01) TaxID=983644 RepID=G3JTE8_CORMM|nr:uncharacterized protein CCM_08338 [Cordyceps militaris CM01]EGX88295.1 hypothetical protein CCM_08338 [Cordyceps militaris CM01]
MVSNQHQRYSRAMMTWGIGYGFFRPPSDVYDQARPGVCGYIDHSGNWRKIVDLNSPDELSAANLTSFSEAVRLQRPSFHTWGPKYTDTVSETTVGVDAGVAAGIPIECSAIYSYSTRSDFAALLLCGDNVRQTAYPHYDPFRRWAKANAKRILQRHGDVATHGLYVMTSTWSARDVYMKAWTNMDNKVTIGVNWSVPEAGGAAASVEYHRGGSTGGWEHPTIDGRERKVLFFGGVYLRYCRLLRHFYEADQPTWPGYLGDGDGGKFFVETDDGAFEVECSII